jgi:hypothetical protein
LSVGDEFVATIFRTLAQITEKEKLKAIDEENYGNIAWLTLLEGIFKEAEKSVKKE